MYSLLKNPKETCVRFCHVLRVSSTDLFHKHGRRIIVSGNAGFFVYLVLPVLVQTFLRTHLMWFGLGVLSSIGFGTGLNTGLLFLFPTIAERATDMHVAGSVFFDIFFALLSITVAWGAGSAVGEIPPFLMAKTLQPVIERGPAIVTRANRCMRWFVETCGTTGVVMMASYPNATFDMCGIVCGLNNMSFARFFMATLVGKALIKAPCQAAFIIAVTTNLFDNFADNDVGTPRFALFRRTFSMLFVTYMTKIFIESIAATRLHNER